MNGCMSCSKKVVVVENDVFSEKFYEVGDESPIKYRIC
jgi:hypothetical protein